MFLTSCNRSGLLLFRLCWTESVIDTSYSEELFCTFLYSFKCFFQRNRTVPSKAFKFCADVHSANPCRRPPCLFCLSRKRTNSMKVTYALSSMTPQQTLGRLLVYVGCPCGNIQRVCSDLSVVKFSHHWDSELWTCRISLWIPPLYEATLSSQLLEWTV